MAFFSRPDLSSVQFKQLPNSFLTLSGQTQIATITGLTLSNGVGGNVIVNAYGASGGTAIGYVLTYDGTVIKPMPNTSSVAMYNPPYSPVATIDLGGIPSGTVLTGRTIASIVEELLTPTMYPVLTDPSSTFMLWPPDTILEVGCSASFIGLSSFDAGCISPQYSSACDKRSDGLCCYDFVNFDGSPYSQVGGLYFMSPYTIAAGANTVYGNACYCAGVQPKDSKGNNYDSPLMAGSTPSIDITVCGIYPYFYGTVPSGGCPAGLNRPTASCALVIGGTKVVCESDNSICINFNSTSDDYIWFAIPAGCTIKTKWADMQINLNNGNIGGTVSVGGNLFPDPALVASVDTACWINQPYNVYISNYQTCAINIMELKNC